MASFTWDELIARARVYVDDDHDGPSAKGWIKEDKWLTFGNVEHGKLRKKWIRAGLVSPAHTDATFTTDTTTVNGVGVLIGVAEDLGNGAYRVIPSGQAEYGNAPFWSSWSMRGLNSPMFYEAHGEGDNLTITLQPEGVTGNFVVRYIPTLTRATSVSQSVEVPDGCDERLVLGMARRAHLKDSGASALLERLIKEEDEQIGFEAFGRLNHDAPRARRTPRSYSFSTSFPTNRALWRY